MLDIKNELGKKIRLVREKKGLSREVFCGDEIQLTVRQLSRIETGESLPTLPKLTFISQNLAVPIHHLIDEKHMELPKKYLQLKSSLLKTSTFKEEDRITLKESYFDKIYEEFYDALPEDEQLSIDVQQAAMDVNLTENTDFGTGILSEYFFQLQHKEEYSLNDLLIVNLYFNCIYYKEYEENLFDKLLNDVISQVDYSVDMELFLVNTILLTAVSVIIKYQSYSELDKIVKISNLIMQKSKDFHKKPIIDMIEGKYLLFSEKNVEKAKEKYLLGAQGAEFFGDQLLSAKIKEEWENDLATNS